MFHAEDFNLVKMAACAIFGENKVKIRVLLM